MEEDIAISKQKTEAESALRVDEGVCPEETNFERVSISRTARNQQSGHYMLESCLNMLIDVASVLDLISDIVILRQLIKYEHS